MFKPLPQETKGVITEAASRIATLLTIDAALYSDIVLGAADWTYLHIRSNGTVEIVKVIGKVAPNKILVVRGQDGTQRESILKNAQVYYTRTLASIYDEVRARVQPVVLTASGEARVQPIYAPVIDVESDAHFEVLGSANSEIVEGNYSPCKPHVCDPLAGLGPFYFTSKIYPINYVEYLTSALVSPTGGTWPPLYWAAPELLQSTKRVFPTGGRLRTLLQTYVYPHEDITATRVFPKTSTLRALLQKYIAPPEQLTTTDRVYPITSTLRTILLRYTHWTTGDPQNPGSHWESQLPGESITAILGIRPKLSSLRALLQTYTLGKSDEITATRVFPKLSSLRTLLQAYTFGKPEQLTATRTFPTASILRILLRGYTDGKQDVITSERVAPMLSILDEILRRYTQGKTDDITSERVTPRTSTLGPP